MERDLREILTPILPLTRADNPIIEQILKEICLYTEWPYGEAWNYDISNNYMKFILAWYKDAAFKNFEKFSSICKFAPGVGLVGKSLAKRETVRMEKLSEDNDFLRGDAARNARFISGLAIPLFNQNALAGMFAFFMTKRQYTDDHNINIVSSTLSGFNFNF
jgi:hypothetical protein